MTQLHLPSHDSRAYTAKRIPQTGLGALANDTVGLAGAGMLGETDSGSSYMPTTPIGAAVGAGVVWGVVGAIAGLIAGGAPKALKWGAVGGASGAAFGLVTNLVMKKAEPETAKKP